MIPALHDLPEWNASGDEAVCLLDAERRILSCNEILARLLGKTPGELVGKTCHDAFHAPADTPAACPFQRMLESRRPEKGFIQVGDIPLEVTVNPFFDQAGRISHAVHIFARAETRAAAQQKLMKLQRLEHVSEISRSIVHDLNSILTMMNGVVAVARASQEKAPELLALVGEVEQAMARGGRLCHQLLAAWSGDSGSRSLVSLAPVIRESAELAALGAGMDIPVDIAKDLWPCIACEDQIAQLVINLVMNARQASRPGQAIRVAARNNGSLTGELGYTHFVTITVQDQGAGIRPEHREKIFQPFFTTKENGTGLGLPTVEHIVRRHLGHLSVQSEVGAGTTFTIDLPAVGPPPPSPP